MQIKPLVYPVRNNLYNIIFNGVWINLPEGGITKGKVEFTSLYLFKQGDRLYIETENDENNPTLYSIESGVEILLDKNGKLFHEYRVYSPYRSYI